MKTSELIGPALDWAVAKCEGYVIEWDDVFEDYWLEHGDVRHTRLGNYSPSTSWEQAGPIIEQEKIAIEPLREGDGWCACIGCTLHDFLMWDQPYKSDAAYGEGPTPLIAAMRAFVASKLGDEVEIPSELQP